MVIIQKRIGQLGNQLFAVAHFAAASIEHKYNVIYPNFEHPIKNFPEINSLKSLKVLNSSNLANNLIHKLCKIVRIVIPSTPLHECLIAEHSPFIDIGSVEFVANARQKLVACEGFQFKDPKSMIKHHEIIKNIFEPSLEIKENTQSYINKYIPVKSKLVAFHIRRKDYKTYNGGIFYYDDSTWIKWIDEARRLITEIGNNFVGIIFSDEDVPNIIKSGSDLISGPGDMFCDINMLSKCDYIIGPPSTFSGWASYIGRVPKLNLVSSSTDIIFKDFQITEW
jgi:phage pi2 protein 07